ncbi:MAG TPA: low temperature requirement protein A [Hyphomicrobiaceae bacterium]|nr:low temperature requirement protein A [Hyphomicrobiaceae bacterium]
MVSGGGALLRGKPENGHHRVTFVELFFDLVFVFAITQLSHALLAHLSILGALQTALLLMAVWWVWIYTSWVTNWLDPETTPVRLLLFVLMLAGLLLSTSLPQAFEARGWPFAGAYVTMQIGRSLFMLWALARQDAGNFRNFQRITVWLCLSALFWIAGACVTDSARLLLWTVALLIEYVSPAVGFWTPGFGRSTTTDWNVEGGHLAERCGLFVIIALGESILVSGAKFAELPWTASTLAAFIVALIGTVAMWWIYFNIGAERASARIMSSADPGRLARLAYTYLHIVLIAGIIVSAVGDELMLSHPLGHAEPSTIAVLLGGPALYLIGNILFKRATASRVVLSHFAGLGLLTLLMAGSAAMSPLLLGAASSLVLVIVAAWETWSLQLQPAVNKSGNPPPSS